ncbi:hypothetical protein NMY22_g10257 [Coprinellus aureogranulatus]|nr:hypothetical protein NMY22_g10257 [Coprinellus aureogranulatus]
MFSSSTQMLLEAQTMDAQLRRDALASRARQLRREIEVLERCHNSLSLPNQLPAEILSSIFLLVLYHHREKVLYHGENEGARWIRVTHVCRHWRQVALGCPTLWAELSFANTALTEVMLSRSRNAPLTVECFSKGGREVEDILRPLLSQSERFRVFWLGLPSGVEAFNIDAILSNWLGPGPLLESLKLISHQRDCTIEFPPRLGSHDAPALKSLTLINCNIRSWGSLPLPHGMTDLYLDPPFDRELSRNNARPSWNQFLASFASMPSLNRLTLKHCLPDGRLERAGTTDTRIPVQLTHLRDLTFVDSTPSMVSCFASVWIPRVNGVRVCLTDIQDKEAIYELMDNLNESVNLKSRRTLTFLQLCDESDTASGTAFYCSLESRPPSKDSRLDMSLICYNSDLNTSDILPAVKKHMDLSQLSSLWLDGEIHLTTDDFKTTFTNLQHLKTITLAHTSLFVAFLETLGGATEGGDIAEEESRSERQGNYPALESLELSEVDFSASPVGHTPASRLTSALEFRSLRIARELLLDISVFSNRGFTRGMLRQIKNGLPNVTVACHVYEDCWHVEEDEWSLGEGGSEGIGVGTGEGQ